MVNLLSAQQFQFRSLAHPEPMRAKQAATRPLVVFWSINPRRFIGISSSPSPTFRSFRQLDDDFVELALEGEGNLIVAGDRRACIAPEVRLFSET